MNPMSNGPMWDYSMFMQLTTQPLGMCVCVSQHIWSNVFILIMFYLTVYDYLLSITAVTWCINMTGFCLDQEEDYNCRTCEVYWAPVYMEKTQSLHSFYTLWSLLFICSGLEVHLWGIVDMLLVQLSTMHFGGFMITW